MLCHEVFSQIQDLISRFEDSWELICAIFAWICHFSPIKRRILRVLVNFPIKKRFLTALCEKIRGEGEDFPLKKLS